MSDTLRVRIDDIEVGASPYVYTVAEGTGGYVAKVAGFCPFDSAKWRRGPGAWNTLAGIGGGDRGEDG